MPGRSDNTLVGEGRYKQCYFLNNRDAQKVFLWPKKIENPSTQRTLSILIYAEPWNITFWFMWGCFGLLVLFVGLVFPAYMLIDRFFKNKQFDNILEKEKQRKLGIVEEPDWAERRKAQELSADVRTSNAGECFWGISNRRFWNEDSKHYRGSVSLHLGM